MLPFSLTPFLGKAVTRKLSKLKHETMCASNSAASSPDEEKPQGCGDTNDQVLTFDCAVLYPQLWISDSKRPSLWGLMCSARLQAQTESRRSEKCDNDSIESYNEWFSQCWDKNDRIYHIWSQQNTQKSSSPSFIESRSEFTLKGQRLNIQYFACGATVYVCCLPCILFFFFKTLFVWRANWLLLFLKCNLIVWLQFHISSALHSIKHNIKTREEHKNLTIGHCSGTPDAQTVKIISTWFLLYQFCQSYFLSLISIAFKDHRCIGAR